MQVAKEVVVCYRVIDCLDVNFRFVRDVQKVCGKESLLGRKGLVKLLSMG